MKRCCKGFTLLELLVVIAILAMLLAILVPSLKLAREQGARAMCLSNQHQLGTAWITYAAENADKLVPGLKRQLMQASDNSNRWVWTPGAPGDYCHEKTWVGFVANKHKNVLGLPLSSGSVQDAMRQALEIGLLFPYAEGIDMYRCPTGVRHLLLTYSIVDSMNGFSLIGSIDGGKINKKMTDIRLAGERIVFIDEGGNNNLGSWSLWSGNGGGTYNAPKEWGNHFHDQIPLRHATGTNFGFADGHAEYRKWKDARTIEFARDCEEGTKSYLWSAPFSLPNPDNDDLQWLQRCVWGRVYRP